MESFEFSSLKNIWTSSNLFNRKISQTKSFALYVLFLWKKFASRFITTPYIKKIDLCMYRQSPPISPTSISIDIHNSTEVWVGLTLVKVRVLWSVVRSGFGFVSGLRWLLLFARPDQNEWIILHEWNICLPQWFCCPIFWSYLVHVCEGKGAPMHRPHFMDHVMYFNSSGCCCDGCCLCCAFVFSPCFFFCPFLSACLRT